jgi:hypothetical protein
MLGIGLKGRTRPTYADALAIGKVIAPEIFDTEASRLGRETEHPLVREYRQKADGLSQVRGEPVTPLQALDEDIQRYEELLYTAGDRDQIARRLRSLESVRPLLLPPRPYSETQLIIRDLHTADRGLPTPPIPGDKYKDYHVSEDRGLRIRLLHPDAPEHAIGADLIYEHHWTKKRMVRIAVIQYKIWNGRALYYSQAPSLEPQMNKLKAAFCEVGLCALSNKSVRDDAYRLPYCSPFLRPTDKLQTPDSRQISSGLHFPICVALRSAEDTGRGGKKIERKNIRSESVTHRVFEEMFNANLLGSRWLTYDELQSLYSEYGILEPDERVVLHAQEFGLT